MSRYFTRFAVVIGLMFLYGCSTTPRVHVRAYMQDKPRVDQELRGNAGYIMGKPKDLPTINPHKKTRKVFVVEIIDKEEIPTGLIKKERAYKKEIDAELLKHKHKKPVKKEISAPEVPDFQLPDFDEIDASSSSVLPGSASKSGEPKKEQAFVAGSFVEYTVEKNDTLQKISKKFYDSFSKWPRIYEANRDQIDNPDSIKPGIVIKIPVAR